MSQFGQYVVSEPLYLTRRGAVYLGSRGSDEPRSFAVKVVAARQGDEDVDSRWQARYFLDHARVQQGVAASGARCWAAIRDLGMTDDSAYVVVDYHPLTAEKLIKGNVDVGGGGLYVLVGAVLQGLEELKTLRGRSHGNLKPSNVLVAGNGDLAASQPLLTDPGPATQAARDGEAGDLRALGEMLYLLVVHEALPPPSAVPAAPSPLWAGLGPRGERWRQFCQGLLAPSGSPDRIATLADANRALARLAPRSSRLRGRRLPIAVVGVLLLLIGAGAAMVSAGYRTSRAALCQARTQWLDRFAQEMNDPNRRRWYQSDPQLRQIEGELDGANLGAIDCDLASPFPKSYQELRQIRIALEAARGIMRDLSPARWQRLVALESTRKAMADRNWAQPSDYLATLIHDASTPGPQLSAGIDRLLAMQPQVEQGLGPVEAVWKQVDAQTSELISSDDRFLSAFGKFLRARTAGAVRLSDAGFDGINALKAQAAEAGELRQTIQADLDRSRFQAEISRKIDPAHVQAGDIRRWLAAIPEYRVKRDAVASAADSLRRRLADMSQLIASSRPRLGEAAALERDRAGVEAGIRSLEKTPVIARDIDDGSFNLRVVQVGGVIDALRKYTHPETPEEWLANLPALNVSSARLAAAWENAKRMQAPALPQLGSNREAFLKAKATLTRLYQRLEDLDRTVPGPPAGLTAAFRAAAGARREQEMDKIAGAIDQNPGVELRASTPAVDALLAWYKTLTDLNKDFPIRGELLSAADRPDEKWIGRPEWKDPAVQTLVQPDLQRLRSFAAVASFSRADLIKTGSTSQTPELAMEAWRRLGSGSTPPPWPNDGDELQAEADLEQRLAKMVFQLNDIADRDAASAALNQEKPIRWRQFVERARSVERLQSAMNLRAEFGIDQSQLDRLNPPARYNVALVLAQQSARAGGDAAGLAALVERVTQAAAELKDARIAAILSRTGGPAGRGPFADQNPGDVFRLQIPGAQTVDFRRVDVAGARAFYLATTELSFGQFAAVVTAEGLWDEARRLPWGNQPGQRDQRPGPRVWEWGSGSPPRMAVPQLWLTPDDDNDYVSRFRASEFNRNALSEQLGGNPSAAHPMQQISAEGAMWLAALCGCRLPSTREWSAAYGAYGRDAPGGRWNLRDQTWELQKRYVAANGGGRWPDEGIYRPLQTEIALNAAARSRPDTDGTLFFRPVTSGDQPFHDLVGNVAEFMCDLPEAFDAAPGMKTAAGVHRFAAVSGGSFWVIGGSALSPPELPVDKPLSLSRTDVPFADVGLRLAFTAPARTYADRVRWSLEDAPFVWPEPTTRAGQ